MKTCKQIHDIFNYSLILSHRFSSCWKTFRWNLGRSSLASLCSGKREGTCSALEGRWTLWSRSSIAGSKCMDHYTHRAVNLLVTFFVLIVFETRIRLDWTNWQTGPWRFSLNGHWNAESKCTLTKLCFYFAFEHPFKGNLRQGYNNFFFGKCGGFIWVSRFFFFSHCYCKEMQFFNEMYIYIAVRS